MLLRRNRLMIWTFGTLGIVTVAAGAGIADYRYEQHDLRKRTANPEVSALRLRQRTLEHLGKLSEGREYLSIRYGPELSGNLSQLNRLMATLDEVATKVGGALDKANPSTPDPGPAKGPARAAVPAVTPA